MLKCKQCGAELQDGWLSCPNCGNWIGRPDHKFSDLRAHRKKTPTYVFVIVATVFVSMIGAVCYGMFRVSKFENDQLNQLMNSSQEDNTPLTAPAESWHKTLVVQGDELGNSSIYVNHFAVGSEWRVVWSAKQAGTSKVIFHMLIRPTDSEDATINVASASPTDNAIKNYSPGDYELLIKSNQPYRAEIDEYH